MSYIVPEKLQGRIGLGQVVRVPVGGRKLRGVVVELCSATEGQWGLPGLKPVEECEPLQLPPDLLETANFMSWRYASSAGRCLGSMLPPRLLRENTPKPGQRGSVLTCAETSELPQLTQAQRECVAAVVGSIESGEHRVFLLFGPTGSGKTEVYLKCIERCLALNKSAILLVPEISLTPQTVARLEARFPGKVLCAHSGLSDRERAEVWRVAAREPCVVVGARSAVFQPARNLGLLVMDEEHDWAFKQEEDPRYHAREVGIHRAGNLGIPVLLGSATPSIESFHKSQQGIYTLLQLPQRVGGAEMPEVSVVRHRPYGSAGLSRELVEAVEQALANKEQALLLLNRRGFHTFTVCKDCGWVARCPHCDVSMVLHNAFGAKPKLVCHYCGTHQNVPSACPRCGGHRVGSYGAGTERLEYEVRSRFPSAKVCRVDRDTTRRKGAHWEYYNALVKGDVDIILGTQMISKGIDIPGITVVGILNADVVLNIPDFRSPERLFQLITQTAGRSGRRDKRGKVIVEALEPEHYAIRHAALQDYQGFYKAELKFRGEHRFPPFAELARVVVSGSNETDVVATAGKVAELLDKGSGSLEVLGPAPALYRKLQGKFRWQVCIKAGSTLELSQAIAQVKGQKWPSRVMVAVDVDPQSVT
ncbi:MAG: replication restart helicase PriA [Bacillota bacterium]